MFFSNQCFKFIPLQKILENINVLSIECVEFDYKENKKNIITFRKSIEVWFKSYNESRIILILAEILNLS